jgi:hypothetical protein
VGALVRLGSLVLLLAACQPDPALADLPRDPSPVAPITRLIVQRGGDRETMSTITEDELRLTATPGRPPSAATTRTATPTARTTTPTATASPTPSATRSPAATARPTVTTTPRPNPDLLHAVSSFVVVERLRAQLSGPADLTQEYDGPDKMRVLIVRPDSAEVLVLFGQAYLRWGSYWRPLPDPPAHVVERLDGLVPRLADLRPAGLASRGIQRARAGRCYEWEVTDNGPEEPERFCLGVADNLPYRVVMPGGLAVEYFDFDADLQLPDEPYPIRE